VISKFRWIVERHGLANFLFHPDLNLYGKRLDNYRAILTEVIRTKGGWIATADSIADWWRRRRASRLVENDGQIAVEGPAKGDAAVWIAHRQEDGVWVEPRNDRRLKANNHESALQFLR